MKFLVNINIWKFTNIAKITGHAASQCLTLSKKTSPETQNSSCGLRGTSQATVQFFHGI